MNHIGDRYGKTKNYLSQNSGAEHLAKRPLALHLGGMLLEVAFPDVHFKVSVAVGEHREEILEVGLGLEVFGELFRLGLGVHGFGMPNAATALGEHSYNIVNLLGSHDGLLMSLT